MIAKGELRIFFLIPSLEIGGAETQLVAMANGLAERGHTVVVGVHYSGGALEERLENVRVIWLSKAGRWDFTRFSLRLVREVRSFRPDVVCSFLSTANILSALLKPFTKSVDTVWSIRSSDMDLSKYDWVARLGAWLETRLSSRPDAIIVNSQAGKHHALVKGMTTDILTVVSNGFDTERFCIDPDKGAPLRIKWGISQKVVLVGLVARLDPMKDHETFLKAAVLAVSRDRNMQFVCVGDGPLRDKLMDRSRSLGLEGRVFWPGNLADMPAVYNALDICCLSSITEGFPNVLGEAMSCGVPCVTTDVGDAARIVGDTGIVVPPQDSQALAEGVLKMGAIVREGGVPDVRSRIKRHFSIEKMVEATEKVFLEIA